MEAVETFDRSTVIDVTRAVPLSGGSKAPSTNSTMSPTDVSSAPRPAALAAAASSVYETCGAFAVSSAARVSLRSSSGSSQSSYSTLPKLWSIPPLPSGTPHASRASSSPTHAVPAGFTFSKVILRP